MSKPAPDLLAETVRKLPWSVAIVTADGRVLFANEAMFGLFGSERRGPVNGLALSDLLPTQILDAVHILEQVTECARLQSKRGPGRVRFRAPGVHRVYWYALLPIAAQEATPAAAVLFEDVTESASLLDDYLGLRDLHEKVIANIPAALAVMDSSGLLSLVNPAFSALAGTKPAACVHRRAEDFAPVARILHACGKPLAEILRTASSTGERGAEWEAIPCRGDNGVERYYHMQVLRLQGSKEGPPQEFFLTMLSDVTQGILKKTSEERMAHVERLAAIGEMMSGLSHEINNPLSIIYGNAQFLSSTFGETCLKDLTNEHWGEILACIGSIEHEADRCSTVVSRLLQLSCHHRFTREGGGKADINLLVQKLLDVYEPRMVKTGIRVTKCLSKGLPPIPGDACELEQVLLNLILNAQQAMPSGGKLEISTEANHDWATIMVRDSGEGISQKNVARIFDPFFTTRSSGKGTGLGLSIARSIVVRLGGQIEVESQEGHGATFFVRLPLAEGAPVPRGEEEPCRVPES